MDREPTNACNVAALYAAVSSRRNTGTLHMIDIEKIL
jgi:hypothetical protein